MDGTDKHISGSERYFSERVVSHKVGTQGPATTTEAGFENKPLIEKKKDLKLGTGFASAVAQAKEQHQQPTRRQDGGHVKIAVFIKKPIKKEGKTSEVSGDDGMMYELKLENGKASTSSEIKEKMLGNLQIPKTSAHLFAIWFISPYLELQLKPHHKPFQLRRRWKELLSTFSDCPEHEASTDEPVVVFQRNSFISISEEKEETDALVLKRLFEEACFNFLNARYRMSVANAERLGGILMRLHEGKYNPNLHQPGFFKRKGVKLSDFLPYYAIGTNKVSQYIYSGGTEQRLLQAYQEQDEHLRRLLEDHESRGENLADNLGCSKMFLDHCHNFPFYASAFFKGFCFQEGVRYKVWKRHKQPVTIAINCYGITLFKGDAEEMLSHLAYSTFSWNYNEEQEEDENGESVTVKEFIIGYKDGAGEARQIQINSKQAEFMDAMVESFSNFANVGEGLRPQVNNDLSKLNIISYIGERVEEERFTSVEV